jgi:CspA family cold shock protein
MSTTIQPEVTNRDESDEETITLTGKVKWFDDAKGFGFIRTEGRTGDLFVHFTGIAGQKGRRTLTQDEPVSFEVDSDAKGEFAVNVRRLNPPDPS